MYVNARAIIERQTDGDLEILIQTRNKPYETGKCLELPGGCVEEYESMIAALRREVWEETGLELSEIEGLSTKIDTQAEETNVECFQAFSVYQTTTGPVDSMGVYFRCKATGELLDRGDGTSYGVKQCTHGSCPWRNVRIRRSCLLSFGCHGFFLHWGNVFK